MDSEQPDSLDLESQRLPKYFSDELTIGNVADKQGKFQDQNIEEKTFIGECHIFSYKDFGGEGDRPETDKDALRLNLVFKRLGFTVDIHPDLKKSDTMKVLEKLSEKIDSQTKYLVCCFLTHGKYNILCTKDSKIHIDKILKLFSRSSCHKSLSGKPKIFIIQACRGDKAEEGVLKAQECSSEVENIHNPNDDQSDQCILDETDLFEIRTKSNPDYLDFLVVNSTYRGTFAFKNKHGSYFIEEFCRTLEHFSDKLDLLQILTIVNYRLATYFASTNEKFKQMPCLTTRLRTDIRFNKKIVPFKSKDTAVFERKRIENGGLESISNPSVDQQSYNIQNFERVQFLSILTSDENFKFPTKVPKNNFSSLFCWKSPKSKSKENFSSADHANGNVKKFEIRSVIKKISTCIAEKKCLQEAENDCLSKTKITDFLEKFAVKKIKNVDCFICFVAGYGDGDCFYDNLGSELTMEDIIEKFSGKNCPSFINIPKIFIFLVCLVDKDSKESFDAETTIPEHADILKVTITVSGSKKVEGAMEKICKLLENSQASADILTELTRINSELVEEYGFYSLENSYLDTLTVDSTLIKTLKFP